MWKQKLSDVVIKILRVKNKKKTTEEIEDFFSDNLMWVGNMIDLSWTKMSKKKSWKYPGSFPRILTTSDKHQYYRRYSLVFLELKCSNLVLLKSEYSMTGKCLSISCSLHFDQELLIEAAEAIVIRLPLSQSWKVNLSDEAVFTSTTGRIYNKIRRKSKSTDI